MVRMVRMVQIVEYQEKYKVGINEMMLNISLEFDLDIISKSSSNTFSIPDVYWIALFDNTVIGTVGLSLKTDYAILKSMMLINQYRGKEIGLSNKLLGIALSYCSTHQITDVYLGTMIQFKAAQRFYQKNGFHLIQELALPMDFIVNPLDSLFFKKCTYTVTKNSPI
jgi:N-acetylglutamate synthase-like GNAT family acetyltransferase